MISPARLPAPHDAASPAPPRTPIRVDRGHPHGAAVRSHVQNRGRLGADDGAGDLGPGGLHVAPAGGGSGDCPRRDDPGAPQSPDAQAPAVGLAGRLPGADPDSGRARRGNRPQARQDSRRGSRYFRVMQGATCAKPAGKSGRSSGFSQLPVMDLDSTRSLLSTGSFEGLARCSPWNGFRARHLAVSSRAPRPGVGLQAVSGAPSSRRSGCSPARDTDVERTGLGLPRPEPGEPACRDVRLGGNPFTSATPAPRQGSPGSIARGVAVQIPTGHCAPIRRGPAKSRKSAGRAPKAPPHDGAPPASGPAGRAVLFDVLASTLEESPSARPARPRIPVAHPLAPGPRRARSAGGLADAQA